MYQIAAFVCCCDCSHMLSMYNFKFCLKVDYFSYDNKVDFFKFIVLKKSINS